MLDRALNTINQGESYYFQLIPLSLKILGANSEVPTPGTTYRFTIFKGEQKFDETKLPIDANYKSVKGQWVMAIPKSPLNFYIPNYNNNRKMAFSVHMFQNENKQDYFIGSTPAAIDQYVAAFQQERKVRFEESLHISEDYHFEYEVYMEKSRFALEKIVKEYKNERDLKSPLRERNASGAPAPRQPPRSVTQPPKKEEEEAEPAPTQQTRAQPRSFARTSPSKEEPPKAEEPVIEATPEPVVAEPVTAEPVGEPEPVKEEPAKVEDTREPSVKKAASISSAKRVPSVNTKVKPLGPKDAARESRLASSRVIEAEAPAAPAKSEEQSVGDKAGMVVFLLVSLVFMYLTMTPNRRA